MTDGKQPRTAKPGDLLSQWWTLGAIAADRRTTGRHMKAGWVIINSYWAKHGNGRASLRYIEKATGLNRKAIVKACRELAEWGHVARVPGIGTRPSEYVPRWVTTTSGVEMATTSDDAASGVQMATTPVAESTPLEGASGVQMDTESYLRIPAYRPAIQKVDDDCGLATPDAAGLAPASPATPQEECAATQAEDAQADTKPTFEALWRAYDYARGKKEAREAWKALPEEVNRAAVIEAAKAWQASWAAQGKPDAPRFTLARWLKDERYDEDAPKGFTKVERGKSASKPKPGGKREFGIGANVKRFTITAHETDGSPFADFFETFTFRADDGQEFTKQMHVISATKDYGDGEDVELKHSLYIAAWGKGGVEGNYVGRVVGATDAKGLYFFNVGQPEEEVEYPDWASAEWREKNPVSQKSDERESEPVPVNDDALPPTHAASSCSNSASIHSGQSSGGKRPTCPASSGWLPSWSFYPSPRESWPGKP
jgi:hypothetical protein